MLPFPVLLAGTLVVYVLAPPGTEGAVEGTKASLRAALPGDTTTEVHNVSDLPEEPEEPAQGQAGPAGQERTTATIRWSADGRTVVIRVRKGNDATAFRRELSFDPRDSLKERGRAAGFAIASMLEGTAPETVPPPEPKPDATAPPPSQGQPRNDGTHDAAHPYPTKPPNFSLDAALSGGVGFGGAAAGMGGGLGARLRLGGPVWIHGIVRLRRGEIGEVRATSTFSQFGAGIYIGGTVVQGRVSAGARADALLEWQYLAHFSGDEPASVGEGRVVPVFGLAGEGSVRISGGVELWLGVGPQIALGKTALFLRGLEASQIPVFRGVVDLGFRSSF